MAFKSSANGLKSRECVWREDSHLMIQVFFHPCVIGEQVWNRRCLISLSVTWYNRPCLMTNFQSRWWRRFHCFIFIDYQCRDQVSGRTLDAKHSKFSDGNLIFVEDTWSGRFASDVYRCLTKLEVCRVWRWVEVILYLRVNFYRL